MVFGEKIKKLFGKALRKIIKAMPNIAHLSLDKIAELIAAFGVPGLVLLVLITVSPWAGAVAITSSLAVMGGPLGMIGGIGAMILLAFIARATAKLGFMPVFRAVYAKLKKKGKTCEEILAEIEGYPISKELKWKIREQCQHVNR